MIDSYRQLANDIIVDSRKTIEMIDGPYGDAALAHVRAWESRLAVLDRECTKIIAQPSK